MGAHQETEGRRRIGKRKSTDLEEGGMIVGKKKTKKVANGNDELKAEKSAVNPEPEQTQEPMVSDGVAHVVVEEDKGSLGESLFNALVQGTSSDQIVSDILNVYSSGRKNAVCCAILNLVGKASGVAHAELDEDVLKDDVDVTTLLEEMYARIPGDTAVYPFGQKTPKFRVFRTAYNLFFERLLEFGYNANVLLDNVLLPTLLRWLIAMSESKARCFRHTSTVALMAIVSALSGLIRDLNNRLVSLKRGKNRQTNVIHESVQAMVELRSHILSQAIHQRLRDVAPEIRLLVFENLKDWILKYDEEFAENKYFRYFGMALYDKLPEIRAEALTMIQKALRSTPDCGSRMFLFLQYFSKRLVEMCSDVNMRCAELAIGVIALMLSVYGSEAEEKELIDNEMIDRVLLTLFDERPTIRREAGVLLRVFIESRIPVDEDTGVVSHEAATELLCTFSATLRAQYKENMPERYLVDALYTSPKELPPFLREYSPILLLISSDDAADVVVGLGFVAALLEKLRGRLNLGPVPKEDRRLGPEKKVTSIQQEAADALVASLSRDAGVLLAGILEKHRGDVGVLCGVSTVIAVMDFKVFTSLEQVAHINALMALMRKATASLPQCEEVQLNQVATAWHAFALQDHQFKTEGRGQLQELLKHVLQQLSEVYKMTERSNIQVDIKEGGLDGELHHIWARMSILSSLMSLGDKWGFFKAALMQHTNTEASLELLRLVLASSFRCVLWQQLDTDIHRKQETALSTSTDVANTASQMVGELLTCIFQVWALDWGQRQDDGVMLLLTDSMLYLCDLCALPCYAMSQVEQDVLLARFAELSELLGVAVRGAREAVKEAEARLRETWSLHPFAMSRREFSRLEALHLRVTSGIARLFVLNRLVEDAAPRMLLQWIHAPTKTVSDVFRCLFRALRDRCNDSLALERSIILEAYNHSADALYQMGLKLSSMHWPLPDKYYAACIGIVRFGMEFATSTNPVILQAIVAYCSKLQQGDALVIAQDLAANEILSTSTDPNARLFMSSICRAAKLEGVTSVTPLRGLKRLRDVPQSPDIGEEHILQQEGVIVTPRTSKSRSRPARSSSAKTPVMLNRVVVEGGWRVRPDEKMQDLEAPNVTSSSSGTTTAMETVEKIDGKQSREVELSPAVTMAATQDTALSPMGKELNYDEIFIATRDFD